MDLETENRIAAILLKEAAELRRQAQREGALAYICQPTVRSRPNSRFLTATVRGVQQANRAVEVNEMWRLREKQMELDNRLKARNRSSRSCKDVTKSHRNRHPDSNDAKSSASTSTSSKKRGAQDYYTTEDEGLRDDEVDEFLHSRTKRGRGAIGSRMDETGPYPLFCPDSEINAPGNSNEELKKRRVLLGPEIPHPLRTRDSSSSDDECSQDERKRPKKSSSKRHSRKHKSKEKKGKGKKEKNRKRHR